MKPLLILDQHFRKLEELFRPESYRALTALCDVRGGQNWSMERSEVLRLLPEAQIYVASRPTLTAKELDRAPHLKATIEVSGAFREGLDYAACFARGIDVLSCSPGFRNAVAEMTLGLMIAGGRSIVAEHEAFRRGAERWLDDREDSDFTLYGQTIGFIGYGQISRETHRLLAPFSPKVLAYDPFLSDAGPDVALTDLETLVTKARVVVMASRALRGYAGPFIRRVDRQVAARRACDSHQPRLVGRLPMPHCSGRGRADHGGDRCLPRRTCRSDRSASRRPWRHSLPAPRRRRSRWTAPDRRHDPA